MIILQQTFCPQLNLINDTPSRDDELNVLKCFAAELLLFFLLLIV